jgi:glutathione S-transferase
MTLHLMSHTLCPYVQRASISMFEKGVPFERTDIDLANKPDWFLALSPLGKTPALSHDQQPIFESVAILEYLEDTQPHRLHPRDPMIRAQHRGWIEFGSSILNDIGGFYSAGDAAAFDQKVAVLNKKFTQLEEQLGDGPFFAGRDFSLVDVVFGPVFRYFDTFDEIGDFGILTGKAKVLSWRKELAARPSIKQAVSKEYPDLLRAFLLKRDSHLSSLMRFETAGD